MMRIKDIIDMQLPTLKDGAQTQIWEDKDRNRKIIEVWDKGDTYEMGSEIPTPITELLEDGWVPIAFIRLNENGKNYPYLEPKLIFSNQLKYKYIND